MNELIRVNYEMAQPTVSARDLHEGLEIGTEFAKWFSRMCEYGFSDKLDYSEVIVKNDENSKGGRPAADYLISVDMAKQIILTQAGLEKLENELAELKSVKRKEVAEKIKVALSFGDLSENSEYDEAKNEQAIVEARIADIEVMLKNVSVIDEDDLNVENIHIGSKVEVRVLNMGTGKTTVMEYKIVGSNEADPLMGNISDESAVGRALLGKKLGDRVEVEVPAGMMEYEVLRISK